MIRFSSCLAPKGDCMNSEKLLLDLDQGFWTTTDGYKTKVHTSTNYISDDYVRLITDYENRDDEVKDYIDNLIAANPNESYITISINPTTKEIEFAFGIYNANLTNYFKHDYKFQLIKDLSKLLYNVDTIDNSTTNEYKQQIGSNFEKYKEIVDSVVVDALVNSIRDIYSGGDIYSGDEEPDCRYYCEFDESILGLSQEFDECYRIGLIFNKERECVDYFIDRVTDDFVDSDVQKELSPYNKEIFRIAENKIKNLVLQKFHTQELYNISKNIDWSGFTEEMFNKFKSELLTGIEKPDWKGSINVGSVSFEITQYEKTEENPWLDYKVFVLGEDNGYEYDNSIPYAFYEGNQFAINMITDNIYEQFKEKFTNLIIEDLKENNIQNSEHVKKEMMRPTINWNNQEQSKQLYFEKLNGKEFFKTETLSNANELKFIINFLEPALDFKKSDAEIVLDYLVGGDYLSFENNTLKYKGDDGKAYGESLFDVLKYIESNIEEHIENIAMNIEDDFSLEEDQEYLKILKEQVLPSIQNKCNILRLKETFKDKSSDMAFNGLDKANFDELYLDCKNSFPSKTDEELLVEAASRMIMSNVNDFGYFSVQNYDELFDKEDGADYRFTLCEAAAKELIDRKISDFSQVEEYIKNQSKEVFKNECLKELEKQTFLDDVEKIVDLSIDSLDKDDYLATYSSVTEEEYDRTKYLFDNFYKTENQTGSIDLNALYNSKESIDNVVTLENGAEIRKVIESDEGEEREYYDLYDKDLCSICDGENYEVKAEINGTYYLKGLDSEYEDSGFALSTDEYLIATKQQNQGKELGINEDTYVVLADKICQAAYEASASGFNYSFDLDEIATLADRDIEWVKTHIEKIGEALVEHNDELLLDFNPNENINLEENHIDFNFCSVGEDANELFKCVEGRWQRKTNRELEADGYIIPVDIKYSFAYKPNPSVRDEQQVLVDSICDLFIEDSEIIDKKVNSLPGGKFNIEFILRHDFAIEPGTDYFNLKFDNINDRILYEMNNIIKNNEKLHCFTIDSIESFIPEEFHVRKNLVLINDETIENFSKTPEEYLKELSPEMVSFAGSSMWREEERFTSDKNNFLEIMETYPAIKNYVEKKWDLLKEKSLQLDKKMESLWEELEDIPFIEDEKGRLILDTNESWHNFEPGTTKAQIWHYFDINHSKGINYLVNEYKSKKDGYEAGYSEEYELNDLTQEEQEPQMYKKIYSKASNGFEYWEDYDDKGNEIHFKNSNGYEQWTEYDDKGNVIHCKDSNRDEEWTDYDEKGNEIHFKNSNGYEYWKEYDEKGNECHFKNSDGLEEWKDYDEKGNLIHCKNSDGYEGWVEYDDKGNEIHFKDSKGWEHWKEYDDKGNEIHFKNSSGLEEWKKYDSNGNVIYCKDSNGAEYWKGYDDKGNEIYYKDSKGFERSSTVEYVSKEQYLQEKIEQTEKDGYETFKEPMQIVEEISKEEFNLEKDFRYLLLENMKTTKSPFVATHKIFEELKQKNDTERIKEFNKYLKDNNCTTKKGFEKFFNEIIGLTKKEPKKTKDKDFNESYSLKR